MKKSLLFFGIIFFTVPLFAEIDVKTTVNEITVYHMGALVNRSADVNLKPGVNVLMFKNLSSKMVLHTLKFKNKDITMVNRTIIKKLNPEEFSQLTDRKEALNNQLRLLELKYNDTGFVKEVDDLEKMMSYYEHKILDIKRNLRSVENKIIDAKNLENIKLDNKDAAILKVTVSVAKAFNSKLEMQYVVGSISWSPSYDITVGSSSDKTIEIKYNAKMMSQTGEDWNNVTIHLSSSFPLKSPTDLPKADKPWTLDGRSSYNKNEFNQSLTNAPKDISRGIELLEGVEYEELSLPSFLKLRTLKEKHSIKSNSTVFTFPIMTQELPANYYYYGFPSLDPEVFLVAEITNWSEYSFVDGVANMTYRGNDIGKSLIKFSESKDTLLLPVGKDNSVYLKRAEMAGQKYFKVMKIGKKQKETQAFEYILKNNNDFPVNFELVDQFPISQTKFAAVNLVKTSGGNINNEHGEILWEFTLKPGQSTKKEFIFSIDMDSRFSYSKKGPMRKKREVYHSVRFL